MGKGAKMPNKKAFITGGDTRGSRYQETEADAQAKLVASAVKMGKNIVMKDNPKGDAGDFHVWCENKKGEVIGDKDFFEYKMIRGMRNLEGEMIYKRWTPEREEQHWKRCQFRIKYQMKRYKENKALYGIKTSFWGEFKNGGQFGQCPYNACQYLKEQKKAGNNDVRICVGSMGWQKTDGSGIFWEYGEGDDGASYQPAPDGDHSSWA
mgnify:FL=1